MELRYMSRDQLHRNFVASDRKPRAAPDRGEVGKDNKEICADHVDTTTSPPQIAFLYAGSDGIHQVYTV